MAKRDRPGRKSTPEKPEVFIASSAEARELTTQIQYALQHDFSAKPWLAGVIAPSQYPLPSLERQLDKTRYAVFVFARDDKVTSRGRTQDATRDNVILEFGLFVGRLGSGKCFVVVPKNRKGLKIPSDLDGFTPITYDDEQFESAPQAAATLVATAIKTAIRQLPADPPRNAAPGRELADAPAGGGGPGPALLAESVADLLSMLSRGDAGIERRMSNRAAFKLWSQTVLKNALHVLRTLPAGIPADGYIAWMRPTGSGGKRKLTVFVAENLGPDYQPFAFGLNEGLAGTVWAEGRPGAHMRAKPHPAWVIRPGCDNATYACCPVGGAAGPGGILGFGSDTGFPLDPTHESVLKAFAAVLAAGLV
ncbi:MAG: nucleotide-binding protein [Gemmataceae bacterium]|nr:nucleotide-binding protein [Gemmataceae bacterium]